MPCRTDDAYNVPKADNTVSKQKYNQLMAEANMATKLLCGLAKEVEKEQVDYLFGEVDGLHEWLQKHEAEDKKRVYNELRKKFPKLSDDKIKKLIATGVFEEE